MQQVALILMVFTTVLFTSLPLGAQSQAPPVPPPSASAAPPGGGDTDLRVRLARLEEALKAQQAESKRLADEHAKLKERADSAWSWLVGGPAAAALAALVFIFGFALPRLRKSIVEEGRHGITKGVIDEILKDEPARVARLFAAQRDEIARLVQAKDSRVWLEGDEEISTQLREMLSRAGFRNEARDAQEADVIVLVGRETCEMRSRALLKDGAFSKGLKPLVLYTGADRITNKQLLADLDAATLVVTANFPATAVMHLATLAALTRRVQVTAKMA